jgi:hypothetical protein
MRGKFVASKVTSLGPRDSRLGLPMSSLICAFLIVKLDPNGFAGRIDLF